MNKFLLISRFLFFISIPCMPQISLGQNVGIGTNTPDTSAMLDIRSNIKGLLIPRTSSLSRSNIITSAKGLMLYDTTLGSFWFHDGGQWIEAGRIDAANSNTLLGYQTGSGLVAGSAQYNTGVGAQALFTNTVGTFNTAVGTHALYYNTSGSANTGIGALALENNVMGLDNTAVGSFTLSANTSGKENVAVGYNSLNDNTTGNNNTAQGSVSLKNNTTGNSNTAIGYQSLYNNTTGSNNTAIGINTLMFNATGYSNTVVGSNAMHNALMASNTVAIGDSALYNFNNNNSFNTAIGSKALFSNVTGIGNTAIGTEALYSNTFHANTATGDRSLYSNSTGTQNTANGYFTLYFNTTGSQNVAIGNGALQGNATGSGNVALGYLCLQLNSGNNNVAIGNQSVGSTSGSDNIGIGSFAAIGGGSSNTLIGSNSSIPGSFEFATVLGANTQANCSHCLLLGGDDVNSRTRVGINMATPVTDLHIIQQSDANLNNTRGIRLQRATGGNQWRTFIDPSNNYIFQYNNNLYSYIEPVGGAFINSSDERLKKDILPLDNTLGKVLQLQAKTYYYNNSKSNDRRLYGFLAQEVEKIFPEFVFTSEGTYKGIAYSNFAVIAIKAIQEQQLLIETSQKNNKELESKISLLERRISLLESR